MWIERNEEKHKFIKIITNLKHQVLILQGARQVGKTSFVLQALQELNDYPKIYLNLLYQEGMTLAGQTYHGRGLFGSSPTGEEFIKNLQSLVGPFEKLSRPVLIFLDEVDRYPLVLESVQSLAEFSDHLKIIMTGSNLENIRVDNAATGRKKYFDLYPITFFEFLRASAQTSLISAYKSFSIKNPPTQWQHEKIKSLFQDYLRLGGLPRLVSKYFDPDSETQEVPDMIRDLVVSIEENVKTVLGEKEKLYEYEDILRQLALLSQNTLKWSRLQVQHAGRADAKRLVFKTVGARVAHKIRLFADEKDMSKFILFDCGVLNYLLNGSDLLKSKIMGKNLSILLETFVGNELIAHLPSRDELLYWKSGNQAEVEFFLKSPRCVGIDVKTSSGHNRSLDSLAIFTPEVECLVKIGAAMLSYDPKYLAKLPNHPGQRPVPFLELPHYLTARLFDFLGEI